MIIVGVDGRKQDIDPRIELRKNTRNGEREKYVPSEKEKRVNE